MELQEPESEVGFLLQQMLSRLFIWVLSLGTQPYSAVSFAWGAAVLAGSLFGVFHDAINDMGPSSLDALGSEGLSLFPLSHLS